MRYIILIGLIFFAAACQKVIDIDVDDTEERIVIEAIYNATTQVVEVKITKTINVFGPVKFPPILGATIQIENENNEIENLTEIGAGVYRLENYEPEFKTNYFMRVTIDGELYESTAFLPEVVNLTSLSQVFEEASIFGPEGYIVFMNFQDPPGPNYYRAVRTVNGERKTQISQQFIFDDSFSEGNFQTVPFFSSRYEVGDTVEVEFRSYSKASYKYYTEMFALAGDGGQSAAPANPVTNWSNGAIGHFAAWGADIKTIIIE